MSIGSEMLEEMRRLANEMGRSPAADSPLQVTLGGELAGAEAEVCALDSLGLAVQELSVWGTRRDVPLEAIATAISQRVTYLLEPLALVERDLEREQVQMRSAPPMIEEKVVEFYEGLLTRHDGVSRLRLRRYRQENGQGRRVNTRITLTHDVFRRLVNDLATILRAPEAE